VKSLRLIVVGGVISYRALFTWIRPSVFVPTMLGVPLFQLLFFVYVGRTSGSQPDSFFIIGNAVQASALAGVFAGTLTISNERWFGTLPAVFGTPASRVALLLGRSLPVIVNGLLVAAFGLGVGVVAIGLTLSLAALPTLAFVLLGSVCCCSAFGMLLGAVGLGARDVFFLANTCYFLMLLFCGVNVPVAELPGWMRTISSGLPLTHGIEAARDVVAGSTIGDVAGLMRTELTIGAVYVALALIAFRLVETKSRKRGTLGLL
jgi:ABC-2 type transport system permease protein